MKRLILILLLLLSTPASAALTKAVAAVDEWANIAQNTVREGATTDTSAMYQAMLHIDVALTSTTAHTGTKIDVQVSSATSGDEDWTTLTSFISITGTAASEAMGTEAAAQTVLEVASTTGFEADEARWIFILDNTVADSEMIYQVSHVSNTSITCQDGITNAHTSADVLWNVAQTLTVTLPSTANRVRVIYDNTYDSNGSSLHTKTRISSITAL